MTTLKIEKIRKPNDGIRNYFCRVLTYGLIYGLIIVLIVALGRVVGLFGWVIRDISYGLSYGVSLSLILDLIFGLNPLVQYFISRLILYRSGDIPWNYARFLDYSAKHRLIQPIGGRYRFIHDLLRKHFAAMPLNLIQLEKFLY